MHEYIQAKFDLETSSKIIYRSTFVIPCCFPCQNNLTMILASIGCLKKLNFLFQEGEAFEMVHALLSSARRLFIWADG
jgi:hypothetical protein